MPFLLWNHSYIDCRHCHCPLLSKPPGQPFARSIQANIETECILSQCIPCVNHYLSFSFFFRMSRKPPNPLDFIKKVLYNMCNK